MPAPRPFALIRTKDQWSRVAHQNTDLVGDVVSLARFHDEPANADGDRVVSAAKGGLAFDSHCRLFHSVPVENRIERVMWAHQNPLRPAVEKFAALDIFQNTLPSSLGDFKTMAPTALQEPRGLAIDSDDRLFIAETGARRILIYDLWDRRLLRSVPVNGRPLDLSAHGRLIYALLDAPAGLVRLDARTGPVQLQLPPGVTQAERLVVTMAGEILLLDGAGTHDARIVSSSNPQHNFALPYATDVEIQTGEVEGCKTDDESFVLVVARRAGEDFLRFCLGPTSVEELPALKGREYDEQGIVCTPDGRIGFWTARGFRHAVAARAHYEGTGRVTTFRLDSGEFNTTWGRVFLDACIPRETQILVHCVAADEPPEEATLARTPPVNLVNVQIIRPDLSPPMPPLSYVPQRVKGLLHRRETGRELPWTRSAANDQFETYEAPVLAEAGRYLWVTLELSGNTRTTPRVRALRAEYPSHDYLRRIPKTFSREAESASFLQRYLSIFEGALGELEARSDARRALLDSRSAPEEILPWLAGFLGLVLDERWPNETRRTMIEEATWLFRFRGTVRGLTRFLEIYTGTRVLLIEKYRLRGLGGGTLGSAEATSPLSNSILGAGFRVGGAVGETGALPLSGATDDAFRTHAHRFSVIIPASLTEEQLAVVRHILELHRPAHTLFDICTVEAGMRVGKGLQVELTSIIGRSGGFAPLQLGGALLGRGSTVGRAEPGTSVGNTLLGRGSRIG